MKKEWRDDDHVDDWVYVPQLSQKEKKVCVYKIKSKTLSLYGQVSEKWEEETSRFDLSQVWWSLFHFNF